VDHAETTRSCFHSGSLGSGRDKLSWARPLIADGAVEYQFVREAPRVTILPAFDPKLMTAWGQPGDVHALEPPLGRIEFDVGDHAVDFDERSPAPRMGPEEDEEIGAVELHAQRGPFGSFREAPGHCLVQRDGFPVALVDDAR